jgi:hypothetical protein
MFSTLMGRVQTSRASGRAILAEHLTRAMLYLLVFR